VVLPFFAGIKLYPALGFFPFDSRLNELYEYAQANRIPVMAHCTRVGSQYIGSNIQALVPVNISGIYPSATDNRALVAQNNIQARINTYYKNNWILNNRLGNNDRACDLFGHPENYEVLLCNYPDLKICLAHMGGSNEIYCDKPEDELKEIWQVDPVKWFERIKAMMVQYPNLYTDISYTLSSFVDKDFNPDANFLGPLNAFLTAKDNNGNELHHRVLFGTDFFMTEQEMRESELYNVARIHLSQYWTAFTETNPVRYLGM
jgi:uncharacterized protein